MNKKFEKERKIISVGLILLAIAIIIIMAVSILGKKSGADNNNATNSQEIQVLTDGTSVNKRINFEKTKRFGDYEISNIAFTSNNNITTITADIKNISQVKIEEKIITLRLFDNQKGDITSLTGMVKTLEPNESTQLKITATLNYIDAYDYLISY